MIEINWVKQDPPLCIIEIYEVARSRGWELRVQRQRPSNLKNIVKELHEDLSEKERRVLQMRFGLEPCGKRVGHEMDEGPNYDWSVTRYDGLVGEKSFQSLAGSAKTIESARRLAEIALGIVRQIEAHFYAHGVE